MHLSHPCHSGSFLQDGSKHRYNLKVETPCSDTRRTYISSCCSMRDSIPLNTPADSRSSRSWGYTTAGQTHLLDLETDSEITPPSLPTTTAASASELRQLAMALFHKQSHASEATPSTGHFPPEAEPAHSVRHSSDKVEMGRY